MIFKDNTKGRKAEAYVTRYSVNFSGKCPWCQGYGRVIENNLITICKKCNGEKHTHYDSIAFIEKYVESSETHSRKVIPLTGEVTGLEIQIHGNISGDDFVCDPNTPLYLGCFIYLTAEEAQLNFAEDSKRLQEAVDLKYGFLKRGVAPGDFFGAFGLLGGF